MGTCRLDYSFEILLWKANGQVDFIKLFKRKYKHLKPDLQAIASMMT